MSMVQLPGLQAMIDSISQERNLPKVAVQEALREALLKGYERYRRTYRPDTEVFDEHYFDNFEVELDTEEEGFRILSTKTIVEVANVPDHQIALKEVQEVASEAQLGDTVILDVTPEQSDFGRMAAIQTKQVLSQKLRDQQRRMVQEEFQDLEGTVLTARVLRFERQSVIMAVSSGLGQPEVDAELLKRDQLPSDDYKVNKSFRVYLKKVSEGLHRGPQLLVSRADAGLVVYLFANEVPEIEDEIVRIVAVAREANPSSRSVGPRTKIAVDTLERDVDPVGACIGARGSRIQVVVNELRGEKIDVIRWSPDPATYIANALSPARVDEVRLINPEDRQAHVLVPEDQLSLAIGKEGQNVRLAARLTGWKIDIKDTRKYDQEEEDRKIQKLLEERRLAEEEEEFELSMDESDEPLDGDSDDDRGEDVGEQMELLDPDAMAIAPPSDQLAGETEEPPIAEPGSEADERSPTSSNPDSPDPDDLSPKTVASLRDDDLGAGEREENLDDPQEDGADEVSADGSDLYPDQNGTDDDDFEADSESVEETDDESMA
ncbi:MAG: transcription termination factor NusA [Leptolyngbyaceae bacterium]|nr:transcription termination factor NusA [Leptolyngbyaceae bacterium]